MCGAACHQSISRFGKNRDPGHDQIPLPPLPTQDRCRRVGSGNGHALSTLRPTGHRAQIRPGGPAGDRPDLPSGKRQSPSEILAADAGAKTTPDQTHTAKPLYPKPQIEDNDLDTEVPTQAPPEYYDPPTVSSVWHGLPSMVKIIGIVIIALAITAPLVVPVIMRNYTPTPANPPVPTNVPPKTAGVKSNT